jgi:hypothetical protein
MSSQLLEDIKEDKRIPNYSEFLSRDVLVDAGVICDEAAVLVTTKKRNILYIALVLISSRTCCFLTCSK